MASKKSSKSKSSSSIKPTVKQVNTQLVHITPKLAKFMKEHSDFKNRRRSNAQVKFLAGEHIAGNWVDNGQPIIVTGPTINNVGKVLNGHHRLDMILQTKQPAWISVRYGVAQEAYVTMDQGKVRTGKDVLEQEGFNYPRLSSTVACGMSRIVLMKTVKCSNSYILERNQNDTSLRKSVDYVGDNQLGLKTLGVTVPTTIGHYLFTKVDPDLADLFVKQLSEGSDLKSKSPILALRNSLIKIKLEKSKWVTIEQKLHMVIRSWNAWCKDSPRSVIRIEKNDPYLKAVKVEGLKGSIQKNLE